MTTNVILFLAKTSELQAVWSWHLIVRRKKRHSATPVGNVPTVKFPKLLNASPLKQASYKC